MPAGVLTPRNRIISESTGLVKLQLSPQRNAPPPSPTRSTKGLKVTLPIVEQAPEASTPSKADLLAKYASKQAKLMELEKQADVLRFELLELQAQLHLEINRDHPLTHIKARANVEVTNLRKKVSTIFLNGNTSPARGGNLNPDHIPAELAKKPSMLFANHDAVRKKASTVFNNKFLADVRGKLDQQHAEIEDFAKKSSHLAKNFFTSLLPKKPDQTPLAADSSFMFENVGVPARKVRATNVAAESSFLNDTILLSDDDSEHSAIDIDDYSSSGDEQ